MARPVSPKAANSEAIRPGIPICCRPPFRNETGHLSQPRLTSLAPRGSAAAALLAADG